MRGKFAGIFALVVALAFTNAAVAGAKGKGKIKPYGLSVAGLINQDGTTDVIVGVDVLEPETSTFTPPSLAKHIQMKTFDTDGVLQWTQNYQDAPLTIEATSSHVAYQYVDVLRHQPIRTQVQVQNEQTTDTEVLRAVGTALLRPDLAVIQVEAPDSAPVGSLLNITATIEELNRDLGANATVTLSDSTGVIDTVEGEYYSPAATHSLHFVAEAPTVAGTYTLTVNVGDVDPNDYDQTNNTLSIDVEIVDPLTTTTFSSNYYSRDGYYYRRYSSYYSGGITETDGYSESWSNYRFIGTPDLSGPIEPPLRVEGSLKIDSKAEPQFSFLEVDIYPQSSYGDCSLGHTAENQRYFLPIEDGTFLYIDARNWCDGSGRYVKSQIQHSAGQYRYYSVYWSRYYGYTDSGYRDAGAIWDARSEVALNMVITDANGTSFGGSDSVAVTGRLRQESSPWSCSGGWYYRYCSEYYYDFTEYSGYASGETTP
jgi:hypothetical protein